MLEALRQLHKGEYAEAVEQLFSANDRPLQKGIDLAFETAEEGLLPFVEEFKYNTSVFNAFKTHAEMDALMDALTDEQGRIRSFRKFQKAVEPIIGKYNRAWLQTEYNTAIRSADAARYYQEALRTKRIFPNLEYLESRAKNKRAEHSAWVGTILPVEHPWWDTHLPPSAWNCQCSVRRTRKEATEVPPEGKDDEEMPDTLRQNPGKSASPFKLSEHPYLKGQGDPTCPECRRQGLVSGAQLSDEESLLCPRHRLAKEAIAKERRQRARQVEREIRDWAKMAIPEHGLRLQQKGHNIRILRRSVRNVSEHFTSIELKEMARDLLAICKRAQFIDEAPIDIYSHNYEKKVARGVKKYTYYKAEWHGYSIRVNMEVIDGEEIPYAINIIK